MGPVGDRQGCCMSHLPRGAVPTRGNPLLTYPVSAMSDVMPGPLRPPAAGPLRGERPSTYLEPHHPLLSHSSATRPLGNLATWQSEFPNNPGPRPPTSEHRTPNTEPPHVVHAGPAGPADRPTTGPASLPAARQPADSLSASSRTRRPTGLPADRLPDCVACLACRRGAQF